MDKYKQLLEYEEMLKDGVLSEAEAQKLKAMLFSQKMAEMGIQDEVECEELLKKEAYKEAVLVLENNDTKRFKDAFYVLKNLGNWGNASAVMRQYQNEYDAMQKQDELEKAERARKESLEKEIEAKKNKKKKTIIALAAVAIVAVLIISGIVRSNNQKKEAARDAQICASLAGKNFTAIVPDWGERHCDFDNNGNVHDYSFDNSGKYWGDTEYVYEVRKLDDGNYALDFAISEVSLFHNGEYGYLVTGIEGTQITEFTDTNDFAGYDVYKLDENSTGSQTAGNTENDSEENEKQAEIVSISDAQVGSYVIFGTYEQDNDSSNGKEDIEWLVLSKENDKLLIVSKYALDCQPYNTEDADVTWENCSLRKWLNGTFLSEAFSSQEQNNIPVVSVSADNNTYFDTNPGNSTEDKVFLLSMAEVENYFSSDSKRECSPTAYAETTSLYVGEGRCQWWLRSPGVEGNYAACVGVDGDVNDGTYFDYDAGTYVGGEFVNCRNVGVRPALWLDLLDTQDSEEPESAPEQIQSDEGGSTSASGNDIFKDLDLDN